MWQQSNAQFRAHCIITIPGPQAADTRSQRDLQLHHTQSHELNSTFPPRSHPLHGLREGSYCRDSAASYEEPALLNRNPRTFRAHPFRRATPRRSNMDKRGARRVSRGNAMRHDECGRRRNDALGSSEGAEIHSTADSGVIYTEPGHRTKHESSKKERGG